MPYPVGIIEPSAWTRLPEASALVALEAAARTAYGAQPQAGILAAPGTQALIKWLPRLFPARRVGVLGFTYAEHEASWRAAGAEVTTVATVSDLNAFDIAIVVNPNNPDGRIVPPDDLIRIAGALASNGGRLIVDEAFMDVVDRPSSLIPQLPLAGAIVLRSFGKAYGLAGVRLGFAVASPGDCDRLRTALGPWPVSGPAIDIGRRALADTSWLASSIVRLNHEANRLDTLLQATGYEIAGGTVLFRLAQQKQAPALFAHLCRSGILTRPFAAQPDWLRFGIPHLRSDWLRLETALEHDHSGRNADGV